MKNRLFLNIRKTCARVADLAVSVKINRAFLDEYAASLPIEIALNTVMDTDNHFCDDSEATLAYFLCLDSINFGSGYFSQLDLEPGKNGYFTVASRLKNDFIRRGGYTANFLQQVTVQECCEIFRQNPANCTAFELMTFFAQAWRDLGNLLVQEFSGNWVNLIKSANCSASTLAEILLRMPFYRDYFPYCGEEVLLLKRAQITASDLNIAFSGRGFGFFEDIEELTIFADNLVPHVLRTDGLLSYCKELSDAISSGQILRSGSNEEIELRACAIHAVELLRETFASRGISVTSQGLDYLLWNRGQSRTYDLAPTHTTRCVYY
ncbi:MAG: hypothetical protein EOM80_03795 [Erysipelotrichia bacterium]|nr:hypothetical protein [Erysipelotrichia bacterium]